MAIIKCKMCGGDLEITDGMSVAECEYCGSRQTIPSVDNDKKLTLFSRANRLRFACEFDKASGVYESLVGDFPEEAEGYWGLVLCKFGIEYVDDPATGRKIPTCHRSSFDSVMDDHNYELAMEYADVAARRVYREEAKQIEELRKGIIEVSGKEEPYDIFLCYKETDENGERTLDSVLAQDVYDALTARGYRVFFSRITLEDKLGQEYEPYIFAALNSAKIMLAFGTDYEYFNAVWVKNEWSRYLQLMTQDKSRHLIPCYKGIDAYDMPKEFAKLQAQDMGKLGAVQDLLRGIEKLLPREEKPAPVVQQVVQQVVASGGPNVLALLKRGNLALEDREWGSAGNFFDQVLNMDAECAEAYLGKALVHFQVSSLDGLTKKLDASRYSVGSVTLQAGKADGEAEEKIVNAYVLPGYLSQQDILNELKYSFAYSSQLSSWDEKKQDVLGYLYGNRDLGRAIKYGKGQLLDSILSAEKQIQSSFEKQEEEARAGDDAHVSALLAGYETLLKEHTSVKELRAQAEQAREKDYQYAEALFEKGEYDRAWDLYNRCYKSHNGYRDAAFKREECSRLLTEQRAAAEAEAARKAAEEKAEAERREAIRKKEAAARAKRNRTIGAVCAVAAVVAMAGYFLVTKVVIPESQYREAEALAAAGQYAEAVDAFEKMGDYKDSADRIPEMKYAYAEALLAEGKHVYAANAFEQLGDYQDSATRVYDAKYARGEALLEAESYDDAIVAFENLGNFKDSAQRVEECKQKRSESRYAQAEALLASGKKAQAALEFSSMEGYSDSWERGSALWREIDRRQTLAAGAFHTLGICSDGTVVATGDHEYGQCDVSGWSDIVEVTAGAYHSAGLRSDGTVVAVGENADGQCDVAGWRDMVTIAAGSYHTVGLGSDGRASAVGYNEYGQCDVSGWSDLLDIAAGRRHTVGLRSDGTVVAAGDNEYGQCDVSEWKNIVAVAAGLDHTVGLCADGRMVICGSNEHGQCEMSGAKNFVSVAAGGLHTVGLRSDGTVVALGDNEYGQCNVSQWNVVAVAAGGLHTVGLIHTGAVMARGTNTVGQCDVFEWTGIRLPE